METQAFNQRRADQGEFGVLRCGNAYNAMALEKHIDMMIDSSTISGNIRLNALD